jgi:biopolymer transport protein ExbD
MFRWPRILAAVLLAALPAIAVAKADEEKPQTLGEAKAKDQVTVIIRADRDARFISIHRTMMAIKAAGFRKLQLRAELPSQ